MHGCQRHHDTNTCKHVVMYACTLRPSRMLVQSKEVQLSAQPPLTLKEVDVDVVTAVLAVACAQPQPDRRQSASTAPMLARRQMASAGRYGWLVCAAATTSAGKNPGKQPWLRLNKQEVQIVVTLLAGSWPVQSSCASSTACSGPHLSWGRSYAARLAEQRSAS